MDWPPFFVSHDVRILSLPTYPFERRRYWAPDSYPIQSSDSNIRLSRLPFTPLSLEFVMDFSPEDEVVRHHAVNGIPVIAGAIQLGAVIDVMQSIGGPFTIETFSFRQMITVPRPIQVKLVIKANLNSGYDVGLSTLDGSTTYSTGTISPAGPDANPIRSLPMASGVTVQLNTTTRPSDDRAILAVWPKLLLDLLSRSTYAPFRRLKAGDSQPRMKNWGVTGR